MSGVVDYFRIAEGEALPAIADHAPFRAVVVIDASYSTGWQKDVSDWLVLSGCVYMMAWGKDCSSWDDSVDYANRDAFSYGEIPDEKFVMTTWHERQGLDDVFWQAQFAADHPDVALTGTLILHISNKEAGDEFLARFMAARDQI